MKAAKFTDLDAEAFILLQTKGSTSSNSQIRSDKTTLLSTIGS